MKRTENRMKNLGDFGDCLGCLTLVVCSAIGRNLAGLGGFVDGRGEFAVGNGCSGLVSLFDGRGNLLAEGLQT